MTTFGPQSARFEATAPKAVGPKILWNKKTTFKQSNCVFDVVIKQIGLPVA